MDRRRPRSGLWRDVGRLAAVIGVLLVVYTLVIMLTSPGALLAWLSTLLSTVVSVLAALVVGLALFQYQTRETDRKKAEELTGLLKTELSEVRRVVEGSRTVVPDEALETTERSFTAHELRISFHYTHPLIVEEAVRSGLGAGPASLPPTTYTWVRPLLALNVKSLVTRARASWVADPCDPSDLGGSKMDFVEQSSPQTPGRMARLGVAARPFAVLVQKRAETRSGLLPTGAQTHDLASSLVSP